MKHVVTLLVVLGLATFANAALLTEDFSNVSEWTMASDGTGVIDFSGGTAKFNTAGDWETMTQTVALGAQSDLVISFDTKQFGGSWAPGTIELFDAQGDSIELGLAVQLDTYWDGGVHVKDGVTSGAWHDLNVTSTTSWFTRTYVISGIGTAAGSATVNGETVNGTYDLTNIGDITSVVIRAKKNFEVDNFVIDVPEPASLALLGMGGLGMLIRRKR